MIRRFHIFECICALLLVSSFGPAMTTASTPTRGGLRTLVAGEVQSSSHSREIALGVQSSGPLGFSIESELLLEDGSFRAETLTIGLIRDRLSLRAGRLTPSFGRAWASLPGLFATEFVEDYEFSGEAGAELGIALTASNGLDELGTSRARLLASVFGAGSFSLALEIEWPHASWSGSAHFSIARLQESDTRGDGWGFAGAYALRFRPLRDLELSAILEYSLLAERGGKPVHFSSGSLEVHAGPWFSALSLSVRRSPGGINDRISELSLGRALPFGTSFGLDSAVELGLAQVRESGISTHRVGLRLSFEFSL